MNIKWTAWAIIVGSILCVSEIQAEIHAFTHAKDQPRESYKHELSGKVFMRKKNLRDPQDLAGNSRIVGGEDADVGEYPFFVEWQGCGASLIHTGT